LPPISLEDVFNHVSVVTSSNLNPPPGRLTLTPRSAEVCLKLGLNPEILKIRDIDSFWENGLDPAIQRIRHEAYVQRRYDTMKQCRLERKRMAVAEFESATNLKTVETLTPEMVLEQQKHENSSLIQLEMQRIEKMQRRQQKELEQMISFEVNRAKQAQEMEGRIQIANKKDMLRKKQQEKRMKLMAEERRLRELQKVAMEEAEEQNRLAVARDMHDREVSNAAETEHKRQEQKRFGREQEEEKKRKHAEHKRQVEQFFSEEQMQLRQRLESMQYAEKKKQDAILKKQTEAAETLRVRRNAIERRIEQNMEMAKLIEHKKKADFLEKQDHFERIRENNMHKQEEERYLKQQELELQEQRRQMILLQMRREEEIKAEEMIEKFEVAEQHVEMVKEVRDKDHMILRERKELRTQMKLENVERVKRMSEYKRMGTLKKIEDSDGRIKSMLDQRRALISERKRAGAQTRRQKESITKVMDEVRTNASKANKIISQAMTGKITLESLTSPTKKRSKSAGGKAKKVPAEHLGLGRDSKSAGYDAAFEAEMDNPEMHKTYSAVGGEGAQEYKSPYTGVQTV